MSSSFRRRCIDPKFREALNSSSSVKSGSAEKMRVQSKSLTINFSSSEMKGTASNLFFSCCVLFIDVFMFNFLSKKRYRVTTVVDVTCFA